MRVLETGRLMSASANTAHDNDEARAIVVNRWAAAAVVTRTADSEIVSEMLCVRGDGKEQQRRRRPDDRGESESAPKCPDARA